MSEEEKILQFQPLTSSVDVSFWFQLSQNKLDEYQLKETQIELRGQYQKSSSSEKDQPSLFFLDNRSFPSTDDNDGANNSSKIPGVLFNTNTIESYKELDKKSLFHDVAKQVFNGTSHLNFRQIWQDIESSAALKNPSILGRFLLITFADIKKYTFYYWFAFPALVFPKPLKLAKVQSLDTLLKVPEHIQAIEKFVMENPAQLFFHMKLHENGIQIEKLHEWKFSENESTSPIFGFVDPCTLSANPGWPLRNFLALVAHHSHYKLRTARIICVRDFHLTPSSRSIVLDIIFPEKDIGSTQAFFDITSAVGWEKNSKGQLAPKMINLSHTMDPVKLSSASVDLNIKLMKWRLFPTLNLEKIKNSKCLLFGAGTLGCNVARCLMGWGIRNITFVDNGNVSYSNPVRQSLFSFEDSKTAAPKAIAAAKALKQIFPEMNAIGKVLSIPMPGHAVSTSEIENVKKAVDEIYALIEQHDVIFILTDSRESRWLPTLFASVQGKLALNSALGFDSYLVMRHGIRSKSNSEPHLGCYFCNDVVAPQNSLKDRTLDQQCTVTRPGLSAIASALAVELFVTTLHHPQGSEAPAESGTKSGSSFGIVPHTIRGFMTQFNNVVLEGSAYDKCTACSNAVVHQYLENGFKFLLEAFNNPTYLEDLTGLTQMKNSTSEVAFEISAEDDF